MRKFGTFPNFLFQSIALALLTATGVFSSVESAEIGQPTKAEHINEPEVYRVEYDIRPLKGKLDKVPVLNSNSPEIVPAEGILLSTFDPFETKHPEAHLKYSVKGPFGLFFHHINKQENKSDRQVLMVSLLAYNPGFSKATVTFNSLVSYVSQPDAPVHNIAPLCNDEEGNVYAGQGDRVVSDYVRGKAVLEQPLTFTIPPRSHALLADLPVKVYGPVSTLNGRTFYAMGKTNRPVQFALLASFCKADQDEDPNALWHPQTVLANMESMNKAATSGGDTANRNRLAELITFSDRAGLSGPREGDKRAPTPPHSKQSIVYGRVSGVQLGSKYEASHSLTLQPEKKLAVSYPISSVEQGTMGTGEVQAAPLAKRYPTSAYAAHGNYCVHYSVDLKLINKCKQSRPVEIALSSPLKTDKTENSLAYYKEQDRRVFFRGVIKVTEEDEHGKVARGPAHYYHLVAHRGERLPPFSHFEMEAGTTRILRIELYYTPDATPPQMLTVDGPLP